MKPKINWDGIIFTVVDHVKIGVRLHKLTLNVAGIMEVSVYAHEDEGMFTVKHYNQDVLKIISDEFTKSLESLLTLNYL